MAFRGSESARACGAAGPYDFDTYEAEDYVAVYNRTIELAAAGKAVTSTFSVADNGEVIDLRYQGLVRGPRGARTSAPDPAARIPPTILKSVAWVESSWSNAATAVPYGGVGPVIRSFDCGYGLGQITSGMSDPTGVPSARQAIIGTHFLFNLAESARIMADKWNSAPRFRPVAGNGDPAALEDWYYAIWSYNGFAFSNHPLNPMRDPLRGGGTDTSPIYHCSDPSAPSYQTVDGALKFTYGDFTYPERVYGCMKYPPQKGGKRLWAGQQFDMPHFELEVVAKAFDPEGFTACENAGFSGGCPKMDFPTTILPPPGSPSATAAPETATPVTVTATVAGPATATAAVPVSVTASRGAATASITPTLTETPPAGVTTHRDTTATIDGGLVAALLGKPVLEVEGPAKAELVTSGPGNLTVTLAVRNKGAMIAPFRVKTSARWLVVRHPGDPASRTLDGGVAIGSDLQVVTQAPSATRPRIAQAGYTSQLLVTLVYAEMPPGMSTGTVLIEPLWGSGKTYILQVTATKAGTQGLPTRAIVPTASSDGPSE